MKNVAFCVLTRGRADRQITLGSLPKRILKKTRLVVDEDEYKDHKRYKSFVRDIMSFPKGWGDFDGNFSDKKEWTAQNIDKRYLFFLDDDLKFDYRKQDKLIKADRSATLRAFQILCQYMIEEGFAHVALSPREGNNRVEEDYRDSTRAMRVCGFDLNVIKKHNLKFNRTILMADFDITLSLLELGYPNRVLYAYANGQRKSNDDGGCSLYRTPETMTQAAQSLKALHPKFVTVTQKKTAKPWCGFDTNVRTDVQVAWRKAYDFGKARTKKGIRDFL